MQSLTTNLTTILSNAFEQHGYDPKYGLVTRSNRADLGDFQCNGALPAGKHYQTNPRQIGQQIIDTIATNPHFAQVSLAGPGFINLRLNHSYLTQHISHMAAHPHLGCPPVTTPQTIILDYGGPNAAKYMHVGHLRATIIGDSLLRLLRFRGDNVIGDIHMGDWGLQMGMLLIGIQEQQPDLPYFDPNHNGPYPTQSPVTMDDLQIIYPAISNRCRTEPETSEAARQATKALQDGQPGHLALWQHIRTISDQALNEDFARLGVKFDLWLGESDTQPLIPIMLQSLITNGHAHNSRGAIIVPVARPDDKKELPPLILVKSDGAVLYATTDLATILQRMNDYQPDAILYVVDARQSLHFEQLFRTAKLAGIAPAGTTLQHLPFGTMNGPDGRPFKTRKGGIMMLRDLVALVTEKALARLDDIEAANDYSQAERETIARQVGIATLKFADLVNHRTRDYAFDVERFSSFEGRTGPYLLYTAVRAQSILRKAAELGLTAGELIDPAGDEEHALLLKLAELPDSIQFAYDTRAPNHLCDYIYNLATHFNRFYRENHILNEPNPTQQASWLALTQATLAQFQLILTILGIPIPQRM